LGRLAETAPTRALFSRALHPYTRALMSAIPSLDPDDRGAAQKLTGEIPSPTNPPPGCKFHTRCPFARERCRVEEPALRRPTLPDTPADHRVACHFAEELVDAVPAGAVA
jgi:oligopeptide/dipeptide ABC transporter ATP-binding protein